MLLSDAVPMDPTLSPPVPSPFRAEEDRECSESHDRYKELISSLPVDIENSWLPLHQFKGYWFQLPILEALMESQNRFKARPSDIIIITYPKSGTVWLKALIFATMNRVKYDPHLHQHPLRTSNPHDCVPFMEGKLYAKNSTANFDMLPSPRAFATHAPYPLLPQSVLDSDCRVVYLSRNPRDTLVSFWHFEKRIFEPKEWRFKDAFDSFCNGVFGFGPYWDHVLQYWNESHKKPEKFLFLKYEDLKAEPVEQLRRLAEFIGYPFTSEEQSQGVIEDILELCSFQNLGNLEVNKSGSWTFAGISIDNASCFRRGEVGGWAEHLSHEMVERLDQVMQLKLNGSGLESQLL